MQSINQSLRQTALMIFLVKRNKPILSVLVDPGAGGPLLGATGVSPVPAAEGSPKHPKIHTWIHKLPARRLCEITKHVYEDRNLGRLGKLRSEGT